jgi:hypothetical protein
MLTNASATPGFRLHLAVIHCEHLSWTFTTLVVLERDGSVDVSTPDAHPGTSILGALAGHGAICDAIREHWLDEKRSDTRLRRWRLVGLVSRATFLA